MESLHDLVGTAIVRLICDRRVFEKQSLPSWVTVLGCIHTILKNTVLEESELTTAWHTPPNKVFTVFVILLV